MTISHQLTVSHYIEWYIDFLFFNVKFNCYVVVELKVTEFKAEYVGQIIKYINYADKNIKYEII